MPEVKISELPTTTSASTGDYLPVVEGGITKRVQAGPGGGLDADTVSGRGIGNFTAWATSTDIEAGDGLIAGSYFVIGPVAVSSTPDFAGQACYIDVQGQNTNNLKQRLYNATTGKNYWRYKSGGTWSTKWYQIWDELIDGNGGQPPAPKPTFYADNSVSHAISNKNRLYLVGAGTLSAPSTGTFDTVTLQYITATGTIANFYAVSGVAGGSAIVVNSADQTSVSVVWRTA